MAADKHSEDTNQMLQARINSVLFARYQRERERWGMTNTEFLERLLTQSLPEWENGSGPPVAR